MSGVISCRARRYSGALAAILCAGASAFATYAAEPAAQEPASWQTVPGGSGTGCATGLTPYEFYVRRGDPRRIAIHFQGGGACWNTRNCGLEGERTFEATVDTNDHPWRPGNDAGIFDFTNPANPLREFTTVLVPYCSADVHLGVGTVRLETEDGKRLDVNFRGLANSQRVMAWVMQEYPAAQRLFVNGNSAGAIPSPIFASQLARHYGGARVVQLGDGAGGYRSARVTALLDLWGVSAALKHDPLFRNLDGTTANFEDFYTRAALVSNLQLAQVNAIEDGVQLFFLRELGHQVTTLAPMLSGNLLQLRGTTPQLRTYTIPGAVHTILRRPELYTTTVDGMPLTAWLEDLIDGKSVKNIGDSMLVPPAQRLQ